MPTKIILFFISFLLALNAFAQKPASKDALQNQRDKLKKEIAQTEKILKETKKTAKVNIGQLSLINKKLKLQDDVVDNISGEIRKLSDNIYLSQLEINKMRRILDTLKNEYAKSMVYAYKNRSNYDFLNFIFSANNFNDAIKRITYLKSYRNYREMQANNILKTQAMVEDKIVKLSKAKQRKKDVLKEQGQELSKLANQQKEKAGIVKNLKGRQKELTAQVNAKRKRDSKLRNAIAVMIKREIALAKAEAARKEKARLAALEKAKNPAEKNTDNKSTIAKPKVAAPVLSPPEGSVLVSSDADKALNASFEKNKGSLPWPVDGFIIYHYGVNKLPGDIDYYSYGVTLGTKTGSPVKAVFDGEVTLVSYIDDKQAVFIKHGKYFTVYSNLQSVNVSRGQKVTTGQVIGKAGINNEGGNGRVDFILMEEGDNVNPESWLKN